MSFQTDSMIPIGSLQPSSNSFPPNDQGMLDPGSRIQGQHSYPGLPHAPTMQQAKDLGPTVSTDPQSPINPALVMSQAPMLQQQRHVAHVQLRQDVNKQLKFLKM